MRPRETVKHTAVTDPERAGSSLADIVDAVGALPEESVLRIAAGLADDLAGLHRTGRAHGNVQPSSVLLTRNGPRLIDSDGDRAAGGGESADLPGPAGGPTEPSGDMFALGTLLVTAYTGRPATCLTSAVPQALDIRGSDAPDIGELPARLRQVVAGCLAEEPVARPTPAQLLDTIGPLTPHVAPLAAGGGRVDRPQAHRGSKRSFGDRAYSTASPVTPAKSSCAAAYSSATRAKSPSPTGEPSGGRQSAAASVSTAPLSSSSVMGMSPAEGNSPRSSSSTVSARTASASESVRISCAKDHFVGTWSDCAHGTRPPMPRPLSGITCGPPAPPSGR